MEPEQSDAAAPVKRFRGLASGGEDSGLPPVYTLAHLLSPVDLSLSLAGPELAAAALGQGAAGCMVPHADVAEYLRLLAGGACFAAFAGAGAELQRAAPGPSQLVVAGARTAAAARQLMPPAGAGSASFAAVKTEPGQLQATAQEYGSSSSSAVSAFARRESLAPVQAETLALVRRLNAFADSSALVRSFASPL